MKKSIFFNFKNSIHSIYFLNYLFGVVFSIQSCFVSAKTLYGNELSVPWGSGLCNAPTLKLGFHDLGVVKGLDGTVKVFYVASHLKLTNGRGEHTQEYSSLIASGWQASEYCIQPSSYWLTFDPDNLFSPALYSKTFKSVFCPVPFKMNWIANQCEAHCAVSQVWDVASQMCLDQPKQRDCKNQTKHPIDVMDGGKYRSEEIISAGVNNPLRLVYYYNNFIGGDKTVSGLVPREAAQQILVAVTPPLEASAYNQNYDSSGLSKAFGIPSGQFYAHMNRQWRHNFEEALEQRNQVFTWVKADGQNVIFDESGSNKIYPYLRLSILVPAEMPYAGHKVINKQDGVTRYFDGQGRLRKLEQLGRYSYELSYDGSKLLEIRSNEESWIKFEYLKMTTASVYNPVFESQEDFPITITSSSGETVKLEWGRSFQNDFGINFLLTRLTHPSKTAPVSSRDFVYGDARWPSSITDIYDVSDIARNERKLFAHFDYDDQGRTIYSGLAGGAESTKVTYIDDYTRQLTNALGKKSTYSFAEFNGVRRLKSVTGEPTATCVKSATEYEYDDAGNIKNEIANGTTLHRGYDNLGREVLRTQAYGTSDAKTTQTCWHPTLNQPARIIEPTKITLFNYTPTGQLKSRTVKPRPAGIVGCETAL